MQDRHYYLPRPRDRVTVCTDAEPITGEVICFYRGIVTVRTDDGHKVMAGKRRVSPSLLNPRSSCRPARK